MVWGVVGGEVGLGMGLDNEDGKRNVWSNQVETKWKEMECSHASENCVYRVWSMGESQRQSSEETSLISSYFVGYLSIAFESWAPGSERR